MQVIWADPVVEHSPIGTGNRNRIASVDIQTDQVTHIYSNSIHAAETIIRKEYLTFTPSRKLVMDIAKEIAAAASSYHREVCGYYWRWIK